MHWLNDLDSLEPNRNVSPRDEMVTPGAEEDYFTIGRRAVDLMLFALRLCGRQSYHEVLDLPCGHGRVMRWLQARFPHAHLTGCDLNRDGVDFCRDQFGAVSMYSQTDLAALPFDRQFDLVWCGSLLTHLPINAAVAALEALIKWTIEDGIIVFSTQGRYLASVLARGEGDFADNTDTVALLENFHRDGVAYQPYYDDLAGSYGLTLMAPEWLTGVLQRHPEVILRAYLEQAWGVQDVVILYKKTGHHERVLGAR